MSYNIIQEFPQYYARIYMLQSIRIFETSNAKMPALICSLCKLRNAAIYSISSI